MNTPKHIAIIMDGNGRWAKKRKLPRIVGHKKGVDTVREIVKHCGVIGVQTLTLFAFSSENKNRCEEEVTLLFKLFLSVLKQEVKKLKKYNVRLKIIGKLSLFPSDVQKTAVEAQTLLADNTGLTLVIAANYGGRWDIVNACQQAIASGVDADTLNEQNFAQYLSLENNAVDLLIRSSGEQRISNFLLWDIAYSELYFTDTLWPDFNASELDQAIESFNHRDRRYGGRDE
ncbi:polyprenyl diphosphate synthase [bacterium endosymbiont of Bathymodiolus sp. 5 South]|jgi:undecaprenyl diphosphate synthase|uniref:polyprenyl diphosphate synthase n=1 Tax=bacterium endosymbiont of Bathymodiolus sp. 5 South TaxID=1181670 RepID=UPI0010B330B3|nr:polyprenyl diphosphate synthase [bacterium endosymbiont of Bathymodiolus sp. 5 South]CAC9466332.1 Undecaprenyl diphosphate synthase (EC 2.5.1.31) [uncultured Gammaproteobacteria bacterium]SHN89932.1 Undecaprenyl diphosphate synthase [bacterium endosymbiont of Bathymodiolus sp. 5 South]SSC07995.1 Undecaprenyl diphosphate synthase [bacterium endosymbiont of Bathymodiolus sp. 5 South]VVH57387.1 Undecaprenyl diphosphate synthase (EC [uncultured Gammaproteobacteria bacterium]VVH63263.1 Undecapre